MAPDLSHPSENEGRFVAALYGSVPDIGPRASAIDAAAQGRTVDRLFQAWTKRLSDSDAADLALKGLGSAADARLGPIGAMAALVRGEGHRMRGYPEAALVEADFAMRALEPVASSAIGVELQDFARVLRLQALADLGRWPEQRMLCMQAPMTVADWRRAHAAGELGQLFFVAATQFRALEGSRNAAADEPQVFRELLGAPVCPPLVRAWGLEALATVSFRAGRYDDAIHDYTAALACAQAAGSRRQMFVAALNIATCHGNLHAPQRAAVWARHALEVLPRGQWPVAEGLASLRLSTALRVAGQCAAALQHAEQACSVLEPLGPSRNRRVAWLTRAEALLAEGRSTEALRWFRAVAAEVEPTAEQDLRVEALRGGALAWARTEPGPQPLAMLSSALELARSMGSRPREAECLLAQLEVWLALQPGGRSAVGCDDDAMAHAFQVTEDALRDGGLRSRWVECQVLRARWLQQAGHPEAAARAWEAVAQSWQMRHRDDLAEQLGSVEELARVRMAEQELAHARDREAMLLARLALTERHAAMLELLEAFSRRVHAAIEPQALFDSLRHHAARLLGARRLRLRVRDGTGDWVCRFGDDVRAGGPEPILGCRLHVPLRVGRRLIGRMSAEFPLPDADGLDRLEQRRIFTLIAEHAALGLSSWLEAKRLRSATDVAREETTRERRGREQAEQLVFDKRRFLAQAGHELRTPLNAIVGFGQLLATSPELGDGPARRHASTLVRAGRQLACLVDDLTELALLDAGSVSLHVEAIDVAAAAAAASSLLEVKALEASVSMHIQGDPGLRVRADRVRLQQVLTNLLSNGIKYGVAGGNVTVSWQPDGNGVRIDVDDDGMGVPPEHRAGLFQPFHRLGRERSGIEGTGLGLSIVQRVAQAMGGRVGYGALARGSRFSLWLPSC